MDINEHAILVRLAISTKGLLGEIKDEGASDTLAEVFNAKDRAGVAGKVMRLNQQAKSIRAVRATAHALRVGMYTYTMPWGKEGHLLPLTARAQFEKNIGGLMKAHYDAKENFFLDYANLVANREKLGELGGLYRAENYPPLSRVRKMFECEIFYSPIPTSGHFIAEVSDKMKERLEQATTVRIREACNSLVNRVEERLVDYVDKLSGYSGGRDGRFNDTLVGNLAEVGQLIKMLNFTNDVGIEQLSANVMRLAKYTAQTLREDEATRTQAIAAGKTLLGRLDAFRKIEKEADQTYSVMAEIEL